MTVINLKTEYRVNPIGLDATKPRFSWVIASENQNIVQTAYSITVTDEAGAAVWETGEVKSGQSVLVEYGGAALRPQTRYNMKVTACDNYGKTASAEGFFEMGLMIRENFKGGFITHGYGDKTDKCPVYTRSFKTAGAIKSARLYATALGLYEARINGEKAGDAFFTPGWTSYHKRLQYQTYDVTNLLKSDNRVEIATANGWYAGSLGFDGGGAHYGTKTTVWAQLEIVYADGRAETIVTDESWRYGTGHIRYSEIYHGEIIDFNCNVTTEGNAAAFEHPLDTLTSQESEPVRITRRVAPEKLITTPNGETVIDFGQNLTGFIEARLNLPKGAAVTIKHAEVLDKNGNFYTENLRGAKATDTFIGSGSGEETFRPTFTFHGFRYIQLIGLDGGVDLSKFTACVLHTDMAETGAFTCSDKNVNRLYQNIIWGQRGNFLDIPTDCPQRDERLGWTGDAQVFAAAASFNYNTALFFGKWLRDLKAEQTIERGVPHVIPNILGEAEGAAAWSDAATIIPWAVYRAFGDVRVLEEQYESMRDWVEYIRSKAANGLLWQSGFQYADWLGLDKEEGSDRVGATDVYFVATAYYAHSAGLTAQAAKVLGKADDAAKYAKLQNDIKAAFYREYVSQTGRLVSETQTACVLALHFGLVPDEFRGRVLETLEANIKKHNNHLTTGFVGTPYLCHALSDNGAHDLAGTIFLKRDYPSWLYAVGMGATTIWERWNSMAPDGSFDESGMNSFNHYAYGSIGDWIVQKLGGLNISEAGYKKTLIAPKPIKGITNASTALKTPYGELSCAWKVENGVFTADITVPCNTTAEITLPGKEAENVGSGVYHFEYPTDLRLETARYSLESTLGELLDNPLALSILKAYSPEIVDNPMIKFALQMSIAQLSAQMPEGGMALFEEVIRQCNEKEATI